MKVRTLVKEAWRKRGADGVFRCQLEVRFFDNAVGDVVLEVSEEQFDAVRVRMNKGDAVEVMTELLFGTFDKPVPSC